MESNHIYLVILFQDANKLQFYLRQLLVDEELCLIYLILCDQNYHSLQEEDIIIDYIVYIQI